MLKLFPSIVKLKFADWSPSGDCVYFKFGYLSGGDKNKSKGNAAEIGV